MRRVLRRVLGRSRRTRPADAPGPVPLTTGGEPAPPSDAGSPRVSGGHVELDGVLFAAKDRVEEVMAAVPVERRIALRLRTVRYTSVYHEDLRAEFSARYAEKSPEYKAFYHALLYCAGCGWEFPGSYTLSLTDALGSYRGVSGATRGYAEFGRTGRCPRCGSLESFLAYESFPPEEIGEDDVAALRRYWADAASRWWSRTGRDRGLCDACSAREVTPGDSYLTSGGTYMVCAGCVEDRLAGALEKLRDDPYRFGASELRRARYRRDPS